MREALAWGGGRGMGGTAPSTSSSLASTCLQVKMYTCSEAQEGVTVEQRCGAGWGLPGLLPEHAAELQQPTHGAAQPQDGPHGALASPRVRASGTPSLVLVTSRGMQLPTSLAGSRWRRGLPLWLASSSSGLLQPAARWTAGGCPSCAHGRQRACSLNTTAGSNSSSSSRLGTYDGECMHPP